MVVAGRNKGARIWLSTKHLVSVERRRQWMLIRKPIVVKPPTIAAGRVAQAISRMAALWRGRFCLERPSLVGDTILTDPPHRENSLVGLRLRSAGIALPPHRSQIRDNHLQLVPRRSGDGRRWSKSERLALFLLRLCCLLPPDRHRVAGIPVRRLLGRESLSGTPRMFLFHSQSSARRDGHCGRSSCSAS